MMNKKSNSLLLLLVVTFLNFAINHYPESLSIALANQSQQSVFVQPELTIEAVEGQGTNSVSAKLDAFRNAISQALGVYVSSDTVVEDYVTKSDKIKTKIEGFIKSAKLKKETKSADGTVVTAVYQVVVSTKPIQQDLKSVLGTEFEAVGHPTVCVVGWYKSADRVEHEANVTAVTALNRALIKRGYKVVDQYEIERLRKEDKEISQASAVAEEDSFDSLALDISNKLKADVYVTTFGSFQGGKTSVSTKMYNSYTAQIFGDETGYGTMPEDDVAGLKLSVDLAVSQSIEKILPLMSEHWQGVLTNGQEYVLVFNNIDGKQRLKIKDLLKKGDFSAVKINSVKQVNSVPNHVEFSVYASGTPDDLFDEVMGKLEEENMKVYKDQYVMRGGRAIFIIEKKN